MAAGAATLAVQVLLGALFLWGLALRGDPPAPAPALEAVAVVDLPPPRPEPDPPPAPEPAASEAGAAPEGVTRPVPREAARPRPPLPFPVPPVSAAQALESDGGGSGDADSGSGAGGAGTGDGAGEGAGDGSGIAIAAQRIAGALRDSDYPREAARQGLQGTVAISFRVRTDGRVDRCTVVRSSGSALLDDLTCRLYVERFRFRPAQTAGGRAVESTLGTTFTWGLRRR